MEEIITKQCSKCGEVKPLDQFNKRSNTRDGLQKYCKDCQAKANKMKSNPTMKLSQSRLREFSPRELIAELRLRGYKGKLTYTQEIVL